MGQKFWSHSCWSGLGCWLPSLGWRQQSPGTSTASSSKSRWVSLNHHLHVLQPMQMVPPGAGGTAAVGSTPLPVPWHRTHGRLVGIAGAAASCLPASSARCASPTGADQHLGATSCNTTCAWTYPEADGCATAEMAHGHLRRWLVPQEPGWRLGNRYQALEIWCPTSK